ncbi:NADP-dependent phosphogluconate dehydrogenase [Glaciimonas sp. Gout2]|uniref:NADP-dependent phosphogluconate dehydrogenase n=1 Tax=unclassified Glaciimonas TaxID=2644401 RepID=UPI002AB33FCD|nr:MULTISPECIES: NADP-dependent phosphogluconate dehydrogenase [unclassified Glaciimonas]MDY7548563.1 NADP-dependent phosphogluconate dehydrogenase [Glaciimonas sp. CA11.2]MEB0013750.1 NADP-dependent phosphogluconate dehydrogenase [Glaciimonas sp. Cout2]MEB0083355.1 NADP-dependent phosphogluconate dehydrogenase [Glaciimonas sp. Gout2]
MTKQIIGVIGLAVMGRNLALNIESRGHSVSVYNRSAEKTDSLVAEFPDRNLVATYSLKEFIDSLEKPRRVLLMVKAGSATDETIAAVKPLLDNGDILIDGGNTHFTDTIRRNDDLAKSGIHFIGTGVSGGEEGALKGPAIMPGGQREAYDLVAPILTEIAAKAADGVPCVGYIGPNGAGHFVKMVHNGIEYGDMQLIAESYAVLKNVIGLSNQELSQVYSDWNKGELNSYLIEITSQIFAKKDTDTDKDLVDVILDRAAQKGTGKWTSQNALDLGAPLPLITEAVFARVLSSLKDERVAASKKLSGPLQQTYNGDRKALIDAVQRALYFSKIISYAQGFAQLRAASNEYKWDLDYGNIAKIFRAGCIIRASFLQKIMEAYATNKQLANLLLDDYFSEIAEKYQSALREVVIAALNAGVPVPAFSSAIAYFDAYRTERLPANLIQAQRDFFGAHTFERIDKKGSFHASWP